jgi:hypothetical protein
MPEITSEDMRRAAADMNRAADRFQAAVIQLDEILERRGRFFEEQVARLETAIAHMT